MQVRAQQFTKQDSVLRHPAQDFNVFPTPFSNPQIPVTQLENLAEDWLSDCQMRQHSTRTIELRKTQIGRLKWFLNHRNFENCGTKELRAFFAYLTTGHQDSRGRWGYGELHQASQPLRPTTVKTYYAHLQSFFNWLVSEELIRSSPLAPLSIPRAHSDQIQPFTMEQVEALLLATKRASYPQRDEALILFLMDTGVRATELCSLKMRDVDLYACSAQVLGKGNKRRTVCFGRRCARLLRGYLRREFRQSDDPVFTSERGGTALTRSGLLQLIHKTGKRAGIQVTRCSPHTFRHTFAVEFLRAGGNVFTLQQLLGHTGLQITQRYVALAQADIQAQHRQFSPGDCLE
jgi:site-specific recombinase XerD